MATNREHLKLIIAKQVKLYGNECALNHVTLSNIVNMDYLFSNSIFNGKLTHIAQKLDNFSLF